MDSHNFIIGDEYRRESLLDFVGSKQAQSGVIWGPLEPGCIICTSGGRHGKKVGYFDQELRDGSWHYFGQGSKGNQSLSNTANSKLASGKASVLIFTTREPTSKEVTAQGGYGKLFTFRGVFNVIDVEPVIPDAGPRKGDSLLRFHLARTIENTPNEDLARIEGLHEETSLPRLQAKLNSYLGHITTYRIGVMEYRKRSAEVRRYAMLRANGTCELCNEPAPFACDNGGPYLEVHHIRRLADDGLDHPENVAAVCPNCHRAAHYSNKRQELNVALAKTIATKEAAISSSPS